MQRKISLAAKVIGLAAALSLTGCAFVPDTVHPTYKPTTQTTKVPGAEKVAVHVIVHNDKKHKNEVSVTKDGYGIPMAGVYMNVTKDFQVALDKALTDRGFIIRNGSPEQVDLVIKHFYMKEQQHFWAPSHTGYAEINVRIKKSDDIMYSHTFTCHIHHQESGVAFSSVDRQKSAEITMNKVVNKIVNDPQVIDALFRAAGQTPPMRTGVMVPASVGAALAK